MARRRRESRNAEPPLFPLPVVLDQNTSSSLLQSRLKDRGIATVTALALGYDTSADGVIAEVSEALGAVLATGDWAFVRTSIEDGSVPYRVAYVPQGLLQTTGAAEYLEQCATAAPDWGEGQTHLHTPMCEHLVDVPACFVELLRGAFCRQGPGTVTAQQAAKVWACAHSTAYRRLASLERDGWVRRVNQGSCLAYLTGSSWEKLRDLRRLDVA
jgi:hypothetical protein